MWSLDFRLSNLLKLQLPTAHFFLPRKSGMRSQPRGLADAVEEAPPSVESVPHA